MGLVLGGLNVVVWFIVGDFAVECVSCLLWYGVFAVVVC